MKAVIWADVFQAFVIICGMFAIVIKVGKAMSRAHMISNMITNMITIT